jgi:hypothetical protein
VLSLISRAVDKSRAMGVAALALGYCGGPADMALWEYVHGLVPKKIETIMTSSSLTAPKKNRTIHNNNNFFAAISPLPPRRLIRLTTPPSRVLRRCSRPRSVRSVAVSFFFFFFQTLLFFF